MDTLVLKCLKFFTLVGDLPHERTMRQPLEIDVEIGTDFSIGGRTDQLMDSLDYRIVHRAITDVVEGSSESPPHLLETVAERVAGELLRLDRVESVVVRCRKPNAMLPGLGTVEIAIERP